MTFPNPTPLGLGNGYHVPAATAAACTRTVRNNVPDDGTADLVLNMLGLADDYETDRRRRGREHGTPAGYRQHQRAKERACSPCLTAWRTYNRGSYTTEGDAMTCRHCDRPLRPAAIRSADRPGTVAHQGRGLCQPCWKAHRDDYDPLRRPHAKLIEELDALGHVSEEEAADRLGVCLGTLARAGRSQRRLDITRRFENAKWRARRTA